MNAPLESHNVTVMLVVQTATWATFVNANKISWEMEKFVSNEVRYCIFHVLFLVSTESTKNSKFEHVKFSNESLDQENHRVFKVAGSDENLRKTWIKIKNIPT